MTRRLAALAATMLSLASTTIIASSASAQSSPVRLGVLGGVNVATLRTDIDGFFEPDNRIGGVLGVQLIAPLSGMVGLEIDGLYSMKGAKVGVSAFDATAKFDYLEFPVLLRLDLAKASPISPYIVAGPSFAVRVSCKFGVQVFISVATDCDNVDNVFDTKLTKTFDAGAVIGGGLDFAVGANTVSFGARYTYGLVDLADIGSIRNRAISLLGGVSMPIGR